MSLHHVCSLAAARRRWIFAILIAMLSGFTALPNTGSRVLAQTGAPDSDGDGIADSADLIVRAVPWLGLPNNPHQVYPGGSLTLQAVASKGYTDPVQQPLDSNLKRVTWDAGNGQVFTQTSGINPMALEFVATYPITATDGQPFTATVEIEALNGQIARDTFRVVVKAKSLDVETNMAIDEGLWYLHKQLQRTQFAGSSGAVHVGWLNSSHTVLADTSGGVQALQINNHVTTGQVAEDPYIHDVQRMLRYLESQLVQQFLNNQTAGYAGRNDNPDTNGNGIGLTGNYGNTNYITGQIMDAFVASGTPNATAVLGPTDANPNRGVRNRKYKDLVQDMIDFNAWSQMDVGSTQRGSWFYYASNNNSAGHGDNSIGGWPAIGGIAAERVWNLTTPAFVKSENKLYLRYSQMSGGSYGGVSADGSFGYAGPGQAWSESFVTSPSSMVQYIYDGVTNDPTPDDVDGDEARFQRGLRNLARYQRLRNNGGAGNIYYCCDTTWGGTNFYALYNIAKTYRLALDEQGKPVPIDFVDDDLNDGVKAWDWYRNDPATPSASDPRGMARAVMLRQVQTVPAGGTNPLGHARGRIDGQGQWTGNMSTAWGIIILSPTLFQVGPTAVCSANPSQIGRNGGNVTLNGAGSFHNDPSGQIVGYAWTFGDGSPNGSGATVVHTYPSRVGQTMPHTYTATLTVTDSNGLTDQVSCAITQVNDNVRPDASVGGVNLSYTFCKGGTLILDGTGSRDEEDGNNLTYAWDWTLPISFTPADATTATVDATAAFANRSPGTYDIGLKVTDSEGASDSEFGTVVVKAADDPSCNQPPVAENDAVVTSEDVAVSGNVTANDSDDKGVANSTVSLVSGPSNGSLTLSANGSFTYTPAAEYSGTDTFVYKLTDAQGLSDTATVSITVNAVNDAPVANPDAKTTPEDTAVSGQVTSSDVDGAAPTYTVATGASNGSVVMAADGSYTYTPNANYNGPDSFTYTVDDYRGGTDTETVSITVTPVNDAPVANPDAKTTPEDTAVSGTVTSSDIDGGAPSYAVATGASNGSVTMDANGNYTYTPNANYNGPDSFTYTVSDGEGGSDTETVSITVTPVNDPPVAGDDSFTTNEDTNLMGSVAGNDSDVDMNVLTFTLLAGPAHGTVAMAPNGTFVYDPAANYFGPDSFTYTVSDGQGGSDTATVSITVTSVNDAPVCSAAAPTMSVIWPPNHQMVSVGVLGLTDVDGDAVSVSITTIYQDEPTNTQGDGNTAIDGQGIGTATAQVRAERSGSPRVPGNGRVYYINFTGTDANGGSCTGTVTVGVPHDQGQRRVPVADGPKYNSATGAALP